MSQSLHQQSPRSNKNQHDFEALAVILSVAMVVAIISLMNSLTTWERSTVSASTSTVEGYSIPAQMRGPSSSNAASGHASAETFAEPKTEAERHVMERFQQAVSLLHAKRYDYAIAALDSVLAISPNMPEAYVNMGFAFLGLEEFGPAQGAFEKALDLKLDQVNAYYGLAIALEGKKEFETALGAMRTYIHLSNPDDPHLVKARAALWEWEAQLGRIKGVSVAPEGELVPEIPKPSWSQKH